MSACRLFRPRKTLRGLWPPIAKLSGAPASLVEYSLLLVLIAFIAIGAMESVGVKISGMFEEANAEIEQAQGGAGQPNVPECVGPFCPPS